MCNITIALVVVGVLVLISIALILGLRSSSFTIISDSNKLADARTTVSPNEFTYTPTEPSLYERCLVLAIKISSDNIGLLKTPEGVLRIADEIYEKSLNKAE